MKTRLIHPERLILLCAVVINSCAPAYIPNVINTPLLDHKGEFQANLNTGFAGFDPQIAYTVTDHLGLMVNGSFANRTSDSTDNFHKHQFLELGMGYYSKLTDNVLFELYGGFGVGKLKSEYDNGFWISLSDVNSRRAFIQPSVGVTTQIFDASLASRFTMVNLFQHDYSNTGYFWEPAITVKLGYEYAKALLQFGFAIPFKEETLDFNYRPFLFSMGLQFTLGKY